MMPGMIMLWYGSIDTIPTGWTLCDGQNGTPNLTGRFIRGAGVGPGAPGITGGDSSHSHDFTGDGHAHSLPAGNSIPRDIVTGYYDHNTDSTPVTGTTDEDYFMPPFHQLCYIMKTPVP